MEQLLVTVWNFILSHWPSFVEGITTTKLIADTADSMKKVLPAKLEAQKLTQDYLENSRILPDETLVIIEHRHRLLTNANSIPRC